MAFEAKYVDTLLKELQKELDKNELKQEIINEKNTRHAFIVSKKFLTPQQYGAALESHIKTKFDWADQTDNTSGDATTSKGAKIEIKCSIEDAKGGFNYVQIRPNHTIDYYLLVNFSISTDELVLLLCPKEEFVKLVVEHGQLAHGTKDTNFAYKEFAYRPKMHAREGTKGRQQWDNLLPWKATEEQVKAI